MSKKKVAARVPPFPPRLPAKVFVAWRDGAGFYLQAGETADELVQPGEKLTVGTYQLVEASEAELVLKSTHITPKLPRSLS